jgi:hypothetical protein
MSLYTPYCLENPRTHDVIVMGRASYLSAAFLGSLFVLRNSGLRAFFTALPANVLFLAGIGLSIFASAWVSELPRIFLLFFVPLVFIVLQGRSMILIVRDHYLARGWWVHEI